MLQDATLRGGIIRTESSDLLAVLDQLNTDTLSDSGVGLLGLNTDLLENNSLGVGRTTEGRGLEGSAQGTLLVLQIRPSLLATVVAQLARGVETSRLSLSHLEWLLSAKKNVSLVYLSEAEIRCSVD